MARDLSFNIIALDNASKTFTKLALQVDKLSERLDALDHKDVNVDVKVDTSKANASLVNLSSRWQLIGAAIIAASPVIGAAITAGVGAGFIGLAALAEKSNAQVKASFGALKDDVTGSMTTLAAQTVPALTAAGNSLRSTFDSLKPAISQVFSNITPDITILTRGIDQLATNAMPGLIAITQTSQPVFQGLRQLMADTGTAASSMFTIMSQHSADFGKSFEVLGSIVKSVVQLASNLIADMASFFSQNGNAIAAVFANLDHIISGLASGAFPILSGSIGALLGVVNGLLSAIGPLAGIIGALGGTALTAFASFKYLGAAIAPLGEGIFNLGAKIENLSPKIGGAIGKFGIMANSMAGPLAIAIGGIIYGLSQLGSAHTLDARLTADHTSAVENLTTALEASGGAIDKNVRKVAAQSIQNSSSYGTFQKLGISLKDLTDAALGVPGAYDKIASSLNGVINNTGSYVSGLGKANNVMGLQAPQANIAKQALELLKSTFGTSSQKAKDLAAAIGDVSAANSNLALNSVTSALAVDKAEQTISDHFKQVDQAVVSARQSMSSANHSYEQSVQGVATAQRGVVTAQQGVVDANRSLQASERGVTDAVHARAQAQQQVIQAQQGIADAEANVVTAENNVTKAQQTEIQAQQALTQARKDAVEQLKALHLQLQDQVTSEESARIGLFDAQAAAAKLGVTTANAPQVISQPLTTSNEAQIKAALALEQAQNRLNDVMNTGHNLREQVTAADKAGVNGSKGVISAQDAVRNALDQVHSSEQALIKAHQAVGKAVDQLSQANYGLTKANQGVQDAEYAVIKAHQGVANAEYSLRQAHLGVTNALYAEQQASVQVQTARHNLRLASDAASRSLDINTRAGQANIGMLMNLRAVLLKNEPKQQAYNDLVQQTANKFGITTQAAADFLKKEGLIPKDFRFNMTAVAAVDISQIQNRYGNAVTSWIENGHRVVSSHYAHAEGGPITGPGTETSDSIPALLSNNEYVVNARSAKKHYALVEAINRDRVPRYAGGGAIGALATSIAFGDMGAEFQTAVDVAGVLGLPHPPGLPKYVPPPPIYGNVGGGSGPIPTGQHRSLIDGALMVDGIPRGAWPRWEAGMNTLIGRESGWNPNAINLWDSNAAAGHPSQGLAQTIPGTFESYRSRSLPDNIRDPMANIAASINYIRSRYGDISAVQQANPNLPPKGYDFGGLAQGAGLMLKQTLRPERVLSPRQTEDFSRLVDHLGNGGGGTAIHNHVNVVTAAVNPEAIAGETVRQLVFQMR